MATASLLQSFPASPERPVPAIWRERFGDALATRMWRQQGRLWWQFWGGHADGAAYLAVQDKAGEGTQGPLPANGLRGTLLRWPLILSRRLLQDQLRPELRAGRGLYSTCLPRLADGQGVFWNPAALGALVGPVAPMLEAYQEGCLSLELDGEGVRWRGEAAPRSGAGGVTVPSGPREAVTTTWEPLPVEVCTTQGLLEREGGSGGSLSRQMIRDPLAARYGIDTKASPAAAFPLRLRLQPQASGPFQASLELQVAVGSDREARRQLLAGLARSLQAQGLQDGTAPAAPASQGGQKGSAAWRRQDNVVLGGWRWIGEDGPAPQLLLFLGPAPSRGQLMATRGEGIPADGELLLWVRPYLPVAPPPSTSSSFCRKVIYAGILLVNFWPWRFPLRIWPLKPGIAGRRFSRRRLTRRTASFWTVTGLPRARWASWIPGAAISTWLYTGRRHWRGKAMIRSCNPLLPE